MEEFAAPVFVVVSMLRSMVWLYRQAARVVARQIHEECKKGSMLSVATGVVNRKIGKSRKNISFLGLYWMGSEKKVMRYFVPWQYDPHHCCIMPWQIILVDVVGLGGSCH